VSSQSTTVSVGSAAKGEEDAYEQEYLEALKATLLHFPKVHLYVLDTIVLASQAVSLCILFT
jgi:hypothetical protein